MLKLLGLLCIFLSGWGVGYAMCRQVSLRYEQLGEIQRMISMLMGEIQYAGTPLPDAFAGIACKVREPFSTFLRSVAAQLRQSTSGTLQEIFTEEVGAHLIHSRLNRQDLDNFIRLGESLGYLDKDMQLRTLGLYQETIRQEMADTYESMPGKKKLYQTLGIMGGLFLVILLL